MKARRQGSGPERITTGVERLDQILNGGIPRHSVVFITGSPGTGKTILAEQALFANARLARSGLYLTTVSEPIIKVLRFLQGFTFFQPELFGQEVVYADLGTALRRGGAPELLKQLDGLVRAHRPQLVVIDSFKAIRDTVRDPLAFREFTSDIAVHLSTWEVTSLLVGEYSVEDLREGSEFAIADGIIYLYGTEEAERQKRFLRVMKMRGTSFFAGEHFFDITSDGIAVYPRMRPEVVGEYEFSGRRIGSTIEGMGEMLGGGVYESTVTLISGGTGSGKTLVALSFLVESARRGQPGLMVSFEESPRQIVRNARDFGWDLEGLLRRRLVDIFHVSPSELDVDRHAFTITKRADELGAKMVVIDSISDIEATVPDPTKYQNYLWAINDYFKRNGITVIETTEIRGPFEPLKISARGVSFVADNIIFLRYIEAQGEIKRVVGVLKMRGSRHDKHLRELIVNPPRIAIGPPVGQADILGASSLWRWIGEP